ncbi:MAG TPA: hypothetical protein VF541_01590 [Longimicrobium sp.]|jgi:tetratricopeptide (TPR) repeat protein
MGESRIVPQAPYRRRLELHILSEIPTALGLVLWQDLRHLRDWADAASGTEREALFPRQRPGWVAAKRAEARAFAPELSDALDAFDELLAERSAADARRLARACVAVAEWAEELRHVETAIQFADAAACVAPDDPRLANLAGRIARNAADFARAEAWFERAIMLAREQKNGVELTRAHLGCGILCKELRRVRSARRHFERAANLARRAGFEWLAAEAQHDLFAYLLVRGHYHRAAEHARKAFALYPKHNRRLPGFAVDLALLLVCTGRYTEAVRLLRLALRMLTDDGVRSLGTALLLRARAAQGRSAEVEALFRRVEKALGRHPKWEAAMHWHLAAAEHALGRTPAARSHARTAIRLATTRHDRETVRLVRKLLQEFDVGHPAAMPLPMSDPDLAAFTETVVRRLAEWSPTRLAREPKTLARREWAA